MAITGPVGRPVVEPPGGSSDTASTALFFASAASSGGRASTTVWSARNKPTARGLPSGGISHNSGTRVASALKGGRYDRDRAASRIDGSNEMAVTAALDGRDKRLLGRECSQIHQARKTRSRERACGKTRAAPELEAVPKPGTWVCVGRAPLIWSHTWGGGVILLANFGSPGGKLLFPLFHQTREANVLHRALLGGRSLGTFEHAQREFSREQFVLGQAVMVQDVTHCSRQTFSLIIARRIQLFIVPCGTFMRLARSS